MPCTAKKFEIERTDEMNASGYPDVDLCITTRELARLMANQLSALLTDESHARAFFNNEMIVAQAAAPEAPDAGSCLHPTSGRNGCRAVDGYNPGATCPHPDPSRHHPVGGQTTRCEAQFAPRRSLPSSSCPWWAPAASPWSGCWSSVDGRRCTLS